MKSFVNSELGNSSPVPYLQVTLLLPPNEYWSANPAEGQIHRCECWCLPHPSISSTDGFDFATISPLATIVVSFLRPTQPFHHQPCYSYPGSVQTNRLRCTWWFGCFTGPPGQPTPRNSLTPPLQVRGHSLREACETHHHITVVDRRHGRPKAGTAGRRLASQWAAQLTCPCIFSPKPRPGHMGNGPSCSLCGWVVGPLGG
eukprot:EG_transcript_30096